MYDKISLVLFYIFRVIAYAVIISIFPVITFFMIHDAFSCSILKAIIYDIIIYVVLYALCLIGILIHHGFELSEEKEREKRIKEHEAYRKGEWYYGS